MAESAFAFSAAQYVTVEGMKIMAGGIYAGDSNIGIEVRNIVAYHGGIRLGVAWSGATQSQDMRLEDSKFLNQTMRLANSGCGVLGNPCDDTEDFALTESGILLGKNTQIRNVELYSGRQGLYLG